MAADLELIDGLTDRMAAGRLDPALNVVTRILGECIRSVNDAWGVFSRSRIDLLPHQLWVCKRVLRIVAHAMAGGRRCRTWQDHRSGGSSLRRCYRRAVCVGC